ncbi:hypothetical protein ACFQVC_00290 [Streptomyces monticola]|uniref:Uncharacterized protein n=1 Tax=Streptomyces monticola TaxID=2666263 RepID=A0ABW2JA11_9ACTN
MTTRWGLIVEHTDGMGDSKNWAATVLAHVDGTREQALAELEKRARGYSPQHPASPVSTRLYRTSDGGFLLVNEGSMRTYQCRFSVAELLYDSVEAERAEHAAQKAAREAERQRREAEKAARKAAKRGGRGSFFSR